MPDTRSSAGPDLDALLSELVALGSRVRSAVLEAKAASDNNVSPRPPSAPDADAAYDIDEVAEEVIGEFLAGASHLHPIVAVTEHRGTQTIPSTADPDAAVWRVIMDPLDGTRELAHDNRSAWFIAGVAPNRGSRTTLADIVGAVQIEIPPSDRQVATNLVGISGRSVRQTWCDVTTGDTVDRSRPLRPSRIGTVREGFAVFVDFFGGSHAGTGALADKVFRSVLGEIEPGQAATFNDQYISNAGQLYLLASGVYRFVADARPIVGRILAAREGLAMGPCAHPYDLSAALIASEAGVVVTDSAGGPLGYPLDTTTPCGWIGYANEAIRSEMEAAVLGALRELEAEADLHSGPVRK